MTKQHNDLRNGTQAAEALGITKQSIGLWAKRPGAPVEWVKGRPMYRWPEFPRWREAELTRKAADTARPKNQSDAEERLAIAQAQLAELKLEEARKVLARKEDVQEAWRANVERFVARARSIPMKAGPMLVGLKKSAEVVVALERFVEEMVGELRDYEPEAP